MLAESLKQIAHNVLKEHHSDESLSSNQGSKDFQTTHTMDLQKEHIKLAASWPGDSSTEEKKIPPVVFEQFREMKNPMKECGANSDGHRTPPYLSPGSTRRFHAFSIWTIK